MPGPLAGVRVLEVASVVMAPWACQTLGDLGADVIKVEPPQGDSNRQIGPARHAGMGALYLSCNRNKRSLVLDLKHELGRRALLKLLEGVDVLVHNHRPATLADLGLEPARLLDLNPRLIVCATCGFDSRGPLRDRPAYDDSIQAASGLAMLAAGPDGEPRYVPTILADKTTASAAVAAICAALYARERTGRGQQVEVPMFETMVAFLMAEHLQGQAFEPPLSGFGYARLLTPFRRPHRTSDGWLAVLPYLDRHWRAFCAAAGRVELGSDGRFSSLQARSANVDAMYREIAAILGTRSTAEWAARLEALGVPVMQVNRLEDLLDDRQLAATGFWELHEHPSEGGLRLPAVPARFSDSPGGIRRLPPRLGEHSREVLAESGLAPSEIQALFESGATRDAG